MPRRNETNTEQDKQEKQPKMKESRERDEEDNAEMADSSNSKLSGEDIHTDGCHKGLQDKPQQATPPDDGEKKPSDQETTPEGVVLGKEEVVSVSEGVASLASGTTREPINQGIIGSADEEPRTDSFREETNTEAVRKPDMQSSSHLTKDASVPNEQSAQSSDDGNDDDRESIDRT